MTNGLHRDHPSAWELTESRDRAFFYKISRIELCSSRFSLHMMRLLPKKCRRGGLWVSGCRESFSYRVEGGDVLTLLTKNHISRHSNQTHSPNQIHSRWSIENQKNLSKNFINSQLRDRKIDQTCDGQLFLWRKNQPIY